MKQRVCAGLTLFFIGLGVVNVGHATYIRAKARLAQVLLVRAWERAQTGETQPRPWPWADLTPVARLRVPEQNVDLLVLNDDSGRTLAFGPGCASGSAMPGEPGLTVINGHRDTDFHFLRRVGPGTRVSLETRNGQTRQYTIVSTGVMDTRVEILMAADADDRLVLTTCYPFDAIVPGGPNRFVVVAVPASPEPRSVAAFARLPN